jgi:hypothetical protein
MKNSVRIPHGAILAVGGLMSLAWGASVPAQSMGDHHHDMAAPKPSTSLTVTLEGTAQTLSPDDLRAMPQVTVKVVNAHSEQEESYSGVRLSEILAKAGSKLGKELLHSYVLASGTDGYWALFGGTEILPGGNAGEFLVALTLNGKPLERDGQLKLVNTEDKKPERWIRNLSAIAVRSVTLTTTP